MEIGELVTAITADRPVFFKRTLAFAGSFDPPAPHHIDIIKKLIDVAKKMRVADTRVPVDVVVWPVGAYDGKQQVAPPKARKQMMLASLKGLDAKLRSDDLDIERAIGTTTYQMQIDLSSRPHTEMRERYFTPLTVPSITTEVWHVIGADNVKNIKGWDYGHELWKFARFLVLARPGYPLKEMPPGARVLNFGIAGACKDIRAAIETGSAWEQQLTQPVADIIKAKRLYGYNPNRSAAA